MIINDAPKRLSLQKDDENLFWLVFKTDNESSAAINLSEKFDNGIIKDIILVWAEEQIGA